MRNKRYICKDHQRALAMENDELSMESLLTKGDVIPPSSYNTKNDGILVITGSTRESKAKLYTVKEVKIIIKEYIGTIDNLNEELEKEASEKGDSNAQLDTAIASLSAVNIFPPLTNITFKYNSAALKPQNTLNNGNLEDMHNASTNKREYSEEDDEDPNTESKDNEVEIANVYSLQHHKSSDSVMENLVESNPSADNMTIDADPPPSSKKGVNTNSR